MVILLIKLKKKKMKNKNLLIGGAVVVGGLLFFYFRKKRAESLETPVDTGVTSTEKGMGIGTSGSGTGSGIGSGSGTSTTSPTTTTSPTLTAQQQAQAQANQAIASIQSASQGKLSDFEVNKRLLGRCGLMPPSFAGKQRNNWDDCKDKFKAELRRQGLISFNGLSEDNVSRLDFDGNIVD
jgi:hypothetical protein